MPNRWGGQEHKNPKDRGRFHGVPLRLSWRRETRIRHSEPFAVIEQRLETDNWLNLLASRTPWPPQPLLASGSLRKGPVPLA
jgi:hypothetical protein